MTRHGVRTLVDTLAQIVKFSAMVKNDPPPPGGNNAGGASGSGAVAGAGDSDRDSLKSRALLSLLKDGMKPLDVHALDMRNQLFIFRSAIERYFQAIGVHDTNDGDLDNEQTRLQIVRSVMGSDAATALIGIADTEVDTYKKIMAVLEDRFAPSDDDVHSLGLVIQCRMRDDETTKQYVNRVRAIVSRMSTLSAEWQTKHILAVLRFTHKSPKLRDLLAEKAPATVQEAEKIAEAFETRVKDKPAVDRLVGALGAGANISVDNVRMRGGASVASARGQCHTCRGFGHIARVCPTKRDNTGGGSPVMRGAPGAAQGRGSAGFFRGRGRAPSRGSTGFRSSHMPANAVDYSGYAERAELAQQDWQSYQPEFPGFPSDQEQLSDYSGAGAAAYAPVDSVGYGYGSPQRAPPQYLPSVQRQYDNVARSELCLLEADLQPMLQVSSIPNEWWTNVIFPRSQLRFKVDTGAKGNVCSIRDLHKLGFTLRDLVPSNVVLVSFTKRLVQPVGTLITRASINGVEIPFVLHVVRECNSPLLSFAAAVQARLIDVSRGDGHEPPAETATVDEFSAYKDEIIHLQLREDARPKQFPPRRVPLALQDQAHFELLEMQREGIIEPVTEPTEWCHPMLVTPKPNGRLRVCMDPRYLNEFLVRAVHPFPDVEQVFSSIRGAKIFSKIDLTHGFWNLRLDEYSSNLCVFSTPWGRFRYRRLPFGVSPAPEVFHRVVADVIKGLPNVIHYIDDILIFAATREEHDALVNEIIRRLKRVGFAICRDKCSFGQSAVTFLGHRLTGDRILPDPLKLEALLCMQPPSNSAELHSFMGFVNYLARYVPNLAAHAEPLRRLMTAKVHFEWTDEQDQAFRQIRDLLLHSPGLAPFDPNLPLVIATDASQHGIGGVLLQNDRPVLYVARSLTPAETRYAIIEKELLAVVFVLTRCHFYTFGRPVTVKTDHKPLLGLVNSDVDKLSLRLRRFLERLFPYALSWTYVPGKDNHFPDALSRIGFKVPLSTSEQDFGDHTVLADRLLHQRLLEGGPLFRDIHVASASDIQFQALMKCAANGWPPKLVKHDARRHLLQPYWALRHELRVVGNFLLYGDRVCVPRSLQNRALHLLHQGHPGIAFMHQRAKNILFWPGVTADTYRFVSQCDVCASCHALPQREPLLQAPPATYPGECVAADFFDLDSDTYLVACDIFSNFPFCTKVSSPSSQALITAARSIFLQTGFPRVFLSDGGPAFRAESFQSFLLAGNCQHRVSSPRYAQSNGAAERVVQTIKNLKKKARSADDLFMALLHLQNTPRPDTGVSPSQLFFGRSQRTPLIPVVRQYSSPWPAHVDVLRRRQQQQAEYYDRHARARVLPTLHPGQRAYLRDPGVPPQIVEILGPAAQPRAYTVRLASGHTSTRNQRFLIPLSRVPPGTPTPTPGTLRPPGILPTSMPPGTMSPSSTRPPSFNSTPAACSGTSLPYASTPAALPGTRPPASQPRPASPPRPASRTNFLRPRLQRTSGSQITTITSQRHGPGPSPTRPTTSTLSSDRDCLLWSSFPLDDPSQRGSAQAVSVPPTVATAPANVLGTSRSGRLVFASLKAQESAATGQARPQCILRAPPSTSPALPTTRPATGASPPRSLPASPAAVHPSTSAAAPPSLTATPAASTPPSPTPVNHASLCGTTNGSVPAAWRTNAITHWNWTTSGLPRTRLTCWP